MSAIIEQPENLPKRGRGRPPIYKPEELKERQRERVRNCRRRKREALGDAVRPRGRPKQKIDDPVPIPTCCLCGAKKQPQISVPDELVADA